MHDSHEKFFSPLDLFYILLLHRLPGFVIALLCILIDFSYPNKPIFFSPFSLLMKCVPVSFSLLMKCTAYIIRIRIISFLGRAWGRTSIGQRIAKGKVEEVAIVMETKISSSQ